MVEAECSAEYTHFLDVVCSFPAPCPLLINIRDCTHFKRGFREYNVSSLAAMPKRQARAVCGTPKGNKRKEETCGENMVRTSPGNCYPP
jgi:hypothetical protein